MLATAPAVTGMWSSMAGGSGVHSANDTAPSIPLILSSALSGALDVAAPTAPVANANTTPNAGATVTPAQGAAAPGTGATAPAGAGTWTQSLPDWLQKILFYDPLTGQDGRTENSTMSRLLVLLVVVALGGGLVYFGIKTLAD